MVAALNHSLLIVSFLDHRITYYLLPNDDDALIEGVKELLAYPREFTMRDGQIVKQQSFEQIELLDELQPSLDEHEFAVNETFQDVELLDVDVTDVYHLVIG